VLFDFLGWGSSDKPSGYPYTTDNQVGDLDAVITQLGLGQVVLVAHDASGPPAIDWALAYPARTAGLVLLNTYYCEMPTLRRPEAIWLFSTPVIRSVARPVSRMFGNWFFRRMYWWQGDWRSVDRGAHRLGIASPASAHHLPDAGQALLLLAGGEISRFPRKEQSARRKSFLISSV
jgi:pimeloyl-ACP methyl ester carboxylesterase